MNITDFANSRGKQPQTISKYIQRHPKEFEKHIKKTGKGKEIELDDVAIQLLNEQYPDPSEVITLSGVPQEQYDDLLKRHLALQEAFNARTEAYIQLLDQNHELALKNQELELLIDKNKTQEKEPLSEKFKKLFKK